jgi:hypothetical protein
MRSFNLVIYPIKHNGHIGLVIIMDLREFANMQILDIPVEIIVVRGY